ncbi:MAG: zinc metallopeptidase [Rhodoglobus sp.]|nr:zinc metallopeptidase [Rhodoglobus sp.]
MWAGVGLFAMVVFFQMVNLPVEFDASNRAKAILVSDRFIGEDELPAVKKVLSAAAMTYVAATLTSVATLVSASVKLTNATAADKGSAIVWRPGPLPEALALDGPKVRQVLANLLDNAVKFSPPGSTITVETEWAASHCSVTVRDQGPGILDSDRIQLFKDFSRTSAKPTGGESSTGLGLAICYKIMQAHAGSIRADNRPEGGAAFRITFPLPA